VIFDSHVYFSYFFAIKYLTIFATLMCVLSLNPVHSVLYLVLVFVTTAVLLISLGAEFLGILLIIVYVGAIAVLFLFVVMMLNIDRTESESGKLPVHSLSGLVVVLLLARAFSNYIYGNFGFFHTIADVALMPIYEFHHLVWVDLVTTLDNINLLGHLLYTQHFHLLVLVGFILFLAMVSSIALTLSPRLAGVPAKTQNKYLQIKQTVSQAVFLSDWKK